MKLIDPDALKEAFRFADTIDAHTAYLRLGVVLSTIDEAPTIEAEPVRHGRWIPVDSYSAFGGSEEVWRAHGNPTAYHYCSECKEQSRLDEFGNEILSKYCLNCGADLREGK